MSAMDLIMRLAGGAASGGADGAVSEVQGAWREHMDVQRAILAELQAIRAAVAAPTVAYLPEPQVATAKDRHNGKAR